ncbi:MAG TPA: DNA polymerase I [Aggregatilineales bacterium]|nr:DNA polymerase I [Aggregatilineales bacterium]HPV08456.1 DNA polymerase I [Aggregatilineales bacterium]HQA68300.1 DNA polymerase I [Aggregatilineales bacterium]HQE17908.1 DNA polymerase I [Aggregatilineales bacterium]
MADKKRKRLVLIDGHALAYRMFFAIQASMSTREGEPTNATYGFTRMLLNIINGNDPPDYMAVSFDVGETFRDAMYDAYKATREKMPDALHVQIERIHDVLDAFNIPILEVDGYEADDVLGTLARKAQQAGVETFIVTGDKDLLQLVDDGVFVQLPGGRTGEVTVYDREKVRERMGIEPEQIVDYKALVGDTSDNIPGVPGIGQKTAVQLLNTWGTLENIYEHLDEIKSARTRNALVASREQAFLSQKLARIVTDVPLEFNLESCRTHNYDRDKVVQIFRTLEFRSFLNELRGGNGGSDSGMQLPLFASAEETQDEQPASIETETHIIRDEAALDSLIARLEQAEAIAFDTETTATDQMSATLVGISLAIEPGVGYYIPVGHRLSEDEGQQLPLDLVIERLRPVMTNPNIRKIAHNIKYDAIVLRRHGLDVYPLSVDTMIGEWLLHPDAAQRKLGLKNLAFFRLGVEMTSISELIGSGRKQITMDFVPVAKAAPYAAADADMTLRLAEPILKELEEQEQLELFEKLEMPLVPVLIDMELKGMLLDVDYLRRMSKELGEVLEQRYQEICAVAGYEFNMNSPQQLSEALFEKLGLPTRGLRKTKSGYYSTAADVLDELRQYDTTGIINAILEYRELEKLRGTYVDALPQLVNPETGRVHTSFNQTGTVTGRLSSSEPNLQNIPVRSEIGRRVREAFIAPPGHVLLGADYSQVELRVLAHVSGDEALREAFQEGQDIHATTAATVYNIDISEVTPAQRSFAKSVNFGLLYGMSAFRLARESELTLPEAEAFVQTYFERFPRVAQYLENTRRQAIEKGYVETLLKRRRYFPALQSSDSSQAAAMARRAAEREAVNMPIQGTAADIMKLAMIKLHRALAEQGMRSQIVLQVHDELLLEVPEEEAEEARELVCEVMENAYPLDVPLKVDAHIGQNWGELKA